MYNFKVEDLGKIPQKLAACIFKYRNEEDINKLSQEMVDFFKKTISTSGLTGIEAIRLKLNLDAISINIINKISMIDKNNENPIQEFIDKYFNEKNHYINLSEREIWLRGYVRQFYDYTDFVYREINDFIEQIDRHYEKHKPKNLK